MLLKSIELQGFKSFADKTRLEFGSGITAVVGPNGSGKSNISDAVRWVLGEQSTKTLRGQRMEDVIFGGTAVRRALGFAEVTLTIDNRDRHIPCDTDDVSVTRRYYRSGESEYRINHASVRLKDVHELFMDTGLGRDGYSMVGQGKIDDIVGSKTSDERRDIFEEAAGISRYRYRRQEAERKLTQAEDNLVRLRDILGELESRVGPLAEQSERARQFLDFSAQKRELEIGLWLHTLDRHKAVLREQDHKLTAARAQYDAAEEEIAQIGRRVEELSDASQRILVAVDEARRKAGELEESAARVDGEAAVAQNTIFHNGETVARIEREIESLAAGDADLEREIAEKNSAARQKREKIREIERALSAAQDELASLMSESDGFSQQMESLNLRLNALSARSADERVKAMTAQSTLAEIAGRLAAVDESSRQKQEQADRLAEELDQLDGDLKRCEAAAQECANALRGRELVLEGRRKKQEQLKQELDRLTLEEGEKRRRAQILEGYEKNMEGFAQSVKAVMRGADHGALRGIHGPVSRLIHAPREYAVALETALGAAVQHIVVGTQEDAKRAIAQLKADNAGRATFLPIAVIKGRRLEEKGLDSCAGFVGVASELVTYDKQYAAIADNLLGRVAVAEDIDSAAAIARQYGYRFKVVTLDGQVVNAGGSFTGGSLIKNAGLLSRTGEIERLRAQADELAAKLAEQTEDYKRAAQELSALEAEMLGTQSELATAQEDKIRVLGEIRRVSEQAAAAQEDLRQLAQERAGAQERVAALNEAVRTAEQAGEELSRQSAALTAELEQATGGRDRTAAKREELSARCTQLKSDIFSENKDIEALVSAAEELRRRMSGESGRREELLREIEALRAQNAAGEETVKALTERAAALRGEASELAAQIERMAGERTAHEQQMQALRTQEREKSGERELLGGELARLEERRLAIVREYDEIIKRLYDEYELTRSEAEETGIRVEDPAAAAKQLNTLKNKIRALGNVNVAAIEEYKEVSERYEFLRAQISDVEQSRDELIKLIGQLTAQMQTLFTERFREINGCFSKIFAELFGGGTAELRLSDPEHVLESGIDIIVQPPGKNISIIEQLSGGEKALIAISIYFAVMKVNPPPFCVLDEVDAALDDVNVTRFADYLRRMSERTQFIVITHRRGTMEEADMLYGVTMQEKGISALLQLNVAEMERQLRIAK